VGRLIVNTRAPRTLGPGPGRSTLEFHRRLPGYAPSPLVRLPALARELGIGALLAKDESDRFGLPAFKILGSSWAVWQLARRALGDSPDAWTSLDDLAARLAPLRPLRLVTATDGNHGRGVARVARWLGLDARIYLPASAAAARVEAIRAEGAAVTLVDGTYDEAVIRAARECDERSWLVQDTSHDGQDEVPRWVIEGYATIFEEIEEQLVESHEAPPDLVLVQIGVGALAAAVLAHWRRDGLDAWPRIVGVEPLAADCAWRALEAGRVVTVRGGQRTIMAGLDCGTLASIAWPAIRDGLDACVTVEDARAEEARRALARHGVSSGESGAAGLAGLTELVCGPDAARARDRLRIGPDTRAFLISTEGPVGV